MTSDCSKCGAHYDDAERITICPHELIKPRWMMEQHNRAIHLLGRLVVFNNMLDGEPMRVTSVNFEGMLTVDALPGEFAPHLVQLKSGLLGG